tara:strand:- start:227 stop:541 length:315 start_codon:yes stop_codon:yes gene_type:complete
MFYYYLENISNDTLCKYQLIALQHTNIIINYGSKKEEFYLNINDTIRWDNNVIIYTKKENLCHYKSIVSSKELIVSCKKDYLKKIDYIIPLNTKLAPSNMNEIL